jgi:hypothetical protein
VLGDLRNNPPRGRCGGRCSETPVGVP